MNIKSIFNKQVEALVQDVLLLERSQGNDQQVYKRVRKQVSGELIHQGQLEITAAAIGALEDEAAISLLQSIVSHCSEHFYLSDRVLSAIALPVTFQMQSPPSCPLELQVGDASHLETLATVSRNLTQSRLMVFDNRLYSGQALFYSNAAKVYRHLCQLEVGVCHPEEGIKTNTASSNTDDCRQMLYFLGVQVTDLTHPRDLDSLESQRILGNWTHRAEWALTQCDPVLFAKGTRALAQCHGFHYLGRAVAEGEEIRRGLLLQSALANFDAGDHGVRLLYAHEFIHFQVKLLVISQAMVIEHCWKLMGSESIEGFRSQLDMAIALVLHRRDVQEVRQVELYDYEKLAREQGLNRLLGAVQ